jgi:soluble lytic murein transglycosylase-like protein
VVSGSETASETAGSKGRAVSAALLGLTGGMLGIVAPAAATPAAPPPPPATPAATVPATWTELGVGHASPAVREAAHAAASEDLARVERLRSSILEVARNKGVAPSLLAAMISRESGAGVGLDSRGLGDHGRGHGLMQIDSRSYGRWLASHNWRDPAVNMSKGVDILFGSEEEVQRIAASRGLSPTPEQLITWTISSYNAGPSGAMEGVRKHGNSDFRTQDGNYARDVLARAEFFRAHGF